MCCSLQANAALTQQLADHEQLLHALRDEASEMSLRLLGAQESLAAKDNLIEQLKAVAVAVRARTCRSGRQCMVMCITALTSMLHMLHGRVKHPYAMQPRQNSGNQASECFALLRQCQCGCPAGR